MRGSGFGAGGDADDEEDEDDDDKTSQRPSSASYQPDRHHYIVTLGKLLLLGDY